MHPSQKRFAEAAASAASPCSNLSRTIVAGAELSAFALLMAASLFLAQFIAGCGPDPAELGGAAGAAAMIPLSNGAEFHEAPQAAPQAAAATFNNLSYIPEGTSGRHAKHVLDLTVPSGDGPFPLVIFLHGGAFIAGSKDDVTSSASAPSTAGPKGYAVASIGYRLSGDPGGKFPGSFNDILTAIRFLRVNAEQYKLDPNRFAVTGFSAGGYHAGMVCVLSGNDGHDLDGFPNLYPGVSSKVQAGVTYAALTDMAKLEEHEKLNPGISYLMGDHGGTSFEAGFLGITQAIKDLPETPGSIRFRANPINYITESTPPLMMIHATNDNVVPWQQSELLVNEINKKVSGRATFDKRTSDGHSGFQNRANEIYKFLDEKMPAGVEPPPTSIKEIERIIR